MRSPEANPRFSPEFQFGSAVSSYQVEGNSSGERDSDWDDFIVDGGPDWWTNGVAERDAEKMPALGLTTLRLGIEWARVMPEKGKIDRSAVERYRKMIDHLHNLGIDPMVTAMHFVLPRWVAQEGGWERSSISSSWSYFTELLADEFGDISKWVTVNEPMNTIAAGYLAGEWPPRKKHDLKGALLARHHLIQAHDICYTTLKKTIPDAFVGAANAVIWVEPYTQSFPDRMLAGLGKYIYNTNFLHATKDMADFIGINYYTGYYLKFNPLSPGLLTGENEKGAHGVTQIPFGSIITPEGLSSDVGWPIVPEFFLKALQSLHGEFKKPIVVTENGIADRDDQYRAYYILTHLLALHEAMLRGVDVRAYYHWSIIDNQEWMDGFNAQFGLIGFDPQTGERTVRRSALLYADIAINHGIDTLRLSEEYLPPDQQEMFSQFFEGLDKRDDS